MQRLKILGGNLTGEQWRALGRLAEKYTPGTPLHLTTRQELEFHNLSADQIPKVQASLAQFGLTGIGACGDTLRNVTVCPCSGLLTGTPDLADIAQAIRKLLEAQEGILSLPRKFKISLSSCHQSCGRPWINDLGLVAQKCDGKWGFRVIGAGSLGAIPCTGIELFSWLDPDDVLPLALAGLRLFEKHGDRSNRRKARLRHVRQRIGDETFKELLAEELAIAKCQQKWPAVKLDEVINGFDERVVLKFVAGDLSVQVTEALAELSQDKKLRVRIGLGHSVSVSAQSAAYLQEAIEKFDSLSASAKSQPSIVACPGTRWCSRGIVDTNKLARQIHDQLAATIPHQTNICISGCPNGCAHSSVGDIGLTGAISLVNGEKREVFRLSHSGGNGMDQKLGQELPDKLTSQEILSQIPLLVCQQSTI